MNTITESNADVKADPMSWEAIIATLWAKELSGNTIGKSTDEGWMIGAADRRGDDVPAKLVTACEALKEAGYVARVNKADGVPYAVTITGHRPPAKIKTRAADAVILEAVEAYREDVERGHRPWAVAVVGVIYGSATASQRGAITRKLNAMDFSDDYHDAKGRFLGFVGVCVAGSPVSFPDLARAEVMAAHIAKECAPYLPANYFEAPRPFYNSYTLCKMLQEQVKHLSFYTASLFIQKHCPTLYCPVEADPTPDAIPPVSGGAPLVDIEPPVTGIAPPADEVGDAKSATPRKATPADHHVTPEALQEAGWDLRYFTIVQRSWATSVDAIMRASERGRDAAIRAEVDEFHHFHDEDDRADFVVYLRIIGSPIAAFEDRPIFAWDEFMAACVHGSPITTLKPLPPIDEDERHNMERVLRETCDERSGERGADEAADTRFDIGGVQRQDGLDQGGVVEHVLPDRDGRFLREDGRDGQVRRHASGILEGGVRLPGEEVDRIPEAAGEELIDPDATIFDLPLDADDTGPYDDYPNADGFYSPWMRPAYEPMTLEEEDAFRAFMAF